MAFKIPPDIMAKYAERQVRLGEQIERVAGLSDEELAEQAEYYMKNMPDAVWRFRPGEPVYDATFFHVIMPEIIQRLTRGPSGPPSTGTPCT